MGRARSRFSRLARVRHHPRWAAPTGRPAPYPARPTRPTPPTELTTEPRNRSHTNRIRRHRITSQAAGPTSSQIYTGNGTPPVGGRVDDDKVIVRTLGNVSGVCSRVHDDLVAVAADTGESDGFLGGDVQLRCGRLAGGRGWGRGGCGAAGCEESGGGDCHHRCDGFEHGTEASRVVGHHTAHGREFGVSNPRGTRTQVTAAGGTCRRDIACPGIAYRISHTDVTQRTLGCTTQHQC